MYNPYKILGVSPLEDINKIRSVYRRLCKKYHPDEAGGDAQKFAEISKAWKTIAESHNKNRGQEEKSVYSFKTLFNIIKVRRTL